MMRYTIYRRNRHEDFSVHFSHRLLDVDVGLGRMGMEELEMKDFLCPIEDHSCPYCEKDGICSLGFPAYQICEDANEAQEEPTYYPMPDDVAWA